VPESLPDRVARALAELAALPDPVAALRAAVPERAGPFEPLAPGPRGVSDEMIVAWLRARVPELAAWPERPCALPTEVHVLVIESDTVRRSVPVPAALRPLFHRPVPGRRGECPARTNPKIAAAGKLKPGTIAHRLVAWLRAHTDRAGYTTDQILAGLGPPAVKRSSLTPTLCALVAAGHVARVVQGRYAAVKGEPE